MDDFLHQRHADEGSKLHAVVMGAAGSGIAFAVYQTAGRNLGWSLLPILLAVLTWGVSFACGIINRRKVMQAIKSNLLRNEAERKGDQIAYDIAIEFIEKHKKAAFLFQEMQLWTLLAGAILYLGGHMWHLEENNAKNSRAELPRHAVLDLPQLKPTQMILPLAHDPDDLDLALVGRVENRVPPDR